MTKQKHLKARVRARMAKTGESYVSARRHVVVESGQPIEARNGYALRGGVHPDTAALANVLANHGVAAERFNRPLSEAMLLGIGGGLGAGYILWQFKGHHPIVTLGSATSGSIRTDGLKRRADGSGSIPGSSTPPELSRRSALLMIP
jgi:hypothetical protein